MTMSLKSTVHRPNEKCWRTCPDIGLLHEPLGLGRSRLVIQKKKKKKSLNHDVEKFCSFYFKEEKQLIFFDWYQIFG